MKTTRDDLYFSDRSSLLIFESVIIKSLCHNLVKTNKIFQVFSECAFQKSDVLVVFKIDECSSVCFKISP